jgi:uncharacterized BrkB/YihY/UPF0761 family membrane protein
MLLIWLYATGWVILLGGELNDVIERQRGVKHTAREGGAEAEGPPRPTTTTPQGQPKRARSPSRPTEGGAL